MKAQEASRTGLIDLKIYPAFIEGRIAVKLKILMCGGWDAFWRC